MRGEVVKVTCQCGGEVKHFGEAMMWSVRCSKCNALLMGVGEDTYEMIAGRWNAGQRGVVDGYYIQQPSEGKP